MEHSKSSIASGELLPSDSNGYIRENNLRMIPLDVLTSVTLDTPSLPAYLSMWPKRYFMGGKWFSVIMSNILGFNFLFVLNPLEGRSISQIDSLDQRFQKSFAILVSIESASND